MQIRNEPITKMANERSRMSESASSPRTARAVTGPDAFGGVCGSAKQ